MYGTPSKLVQEAKKKQPTIKKNSIWLACFLISTMLVLTEFTYLIMVVKTYITLQNNDLKNMIETHETVKYREVIPYELFFVIHSCQHVFFFNLTTNVHNLSFSTTLKNFYYVNLSLAYSLTSCQNTLYEGFVVDYLNTFSINYQ
jgi:hypothetical protein